MRDLISLGTLGRRSRQTVGILGLAVAGASSVHAQLAARVASLSQRVTNQMNHIDRDIDTSPVVSLPLLADVT